MLDEDKQKYKKVKEKFDAHFDKRKNIIYERAKFNMRKQDGESVDDFITSLYGLVEHCNYGVLQDEMIRDQLVARVRDASLSLKLVGFRVNVGKGRFNRTSELNYQKTTDSIEGRETRG